MPHLEILADDVRCSHGATMGQLDEQARFYLASRGLPPDLATALLCQAFAAKGVSDAVTAKVRQGMLAVVQQWLEGLHGKGGHNSGGEPLTAKGLSL